MPGKKRNRTFNQFPTTSNNATLGNVSKMLKTADQRGGAILGEVAGGTGSVSKRAVAFGRNVKGKVSGAIDDFMKPGGTFTGAISSIGTFMQRSNHFSSEIDRVGVGRALTQLNKGSRQRIQADPVNKMAGTSNAVWDQALNEYCIDGEQTRFSPTYATVASKFMNPNQPAYSQLQIGGQPPTITSDYPSQGPSSSARPFQGTSSSYRKFGPPLSGDPDTRQPQPTPYSITAPTINGDLHPDADIATNDTPAPGGTGESLNNGPGREDVEMAAVQFSAGNAFSDVYPKMAQKARMPVPTGALPSVSQQPSLSAEQAMGYAKTISGQVFNNIEAANPGTTRSDDYPALSNLLTNMLASVIGGASASPASTAPEIGNFIVHQFRNIQLHPGDALDTLHALDRIAAIDSRLVNFMISQSMSLFGRNLFTPEAVAARAAQLAARTVGPNDGKVDPENFNPRPERDGPHQDESEAGRAARSDAADQRYRERMDRGISVDADGNLRNSAGELVDHQGNVMVQGADDGKANDVLGRADIERRRRSMILEDMEARRRAAARAAGGGGAEGKGDDGNGAINNHRINQDLLNAILAGGVADAAMQSNAPKGIWERIKGWWGGGGGNEQINSGGNNNNRRSGGGNNNQNNEGFDWGGKGGGSEEQKDPYADMIENERDKLSALRPFFPVMGTDFLQDNVEQDELKEQNLMMGMYKPANWPLGNVDNPFWIDNLVNEGYRYVDPLCVMPPIIQGGNLTDGATLYESWVPVPRRQSQPCLDFTNRRLRVR